LLFLLLLMVVLAIARFAFPPQARDDPIAAPALRSPSFAAALPASTHAPDSAATSPLDEIDVPGNAFPVRIAASPAVASAPAPAAATAARVSVPNVTLPPPVLVAAPVAPPPPLQVIGTYDDGAAPAVFIATPTETLIARPGTLLLSDYRVVGITAQAVALTQVSTNLALQLTVPRGDGR
jgi:hypothetical protein